MLSENKIIIAYLVQQLATLSDSEPADIISELVGTAWDEQTAGELNKIIGCDLGF